MRARRVAHVLTFAVLAGSAACGCSDLPAAGASPDSGTAGAAGSGGAAGAAGSGGVAGAAGSGDAAAACGPVGVGSIERLDPAFDALVPPDAKLEQIAGPFTFTEGPLWRPDGTLWFSDVQDNVVRQWSPDCSVKTILDPGGYDGPPLAKGTAVGPNGMVFDKDGSVVLCQMGNRRIVRVAPDLTITTVVDSYQGKKLNSPDDLVFRSDGSLYFTDPPYGLEGQDNDPLKELAFNGVFRLANGTLQLLDKSLSRPNGIGFSPDEKTLYVANSDINNPVWMRYDVAADGSISNGTVLYDASGEAFPGFGVPDSLKLDALGNIYSAGPFGLWVISPEGKHLGTIKTPTPDVPSNCAWGDDGKTLYITARKHLYRIKLSVSGEKPVY